MCVLPIAALLGCYTRDALLFPENNIGFQYIPYVKIMTPDDKLNLGVIIKIR